MVRRGLRPSDGEFSGGTDDSDRRTFRSLEITSHPLGPATLIHVVVTS